MLNTSAPRKKHASTHHQDQSSIYDQPSMNAPGQYHTEDPQQQLKRKPAAGRRLSRDDIPPDGLQDARPQNPRNPSMTVFEEGTSRGAVPRNSRVPHGQYEDHSRYGDQIQPETSPPIGVASKFGRLSKMSGRNKQSEGKNCQISKSQCA